MAKRYVSIHALILHLFQVTHVADARVAPPRAEIRVLRNPITKTCWQCSRTEVYTSSVINSPTMYATKAD